MHWTGLIHNWWNTENNEPIRFDMTTRRGQDPMKDALIQTILGQNNANRGLIGKHLIEVHVSK